MSRIRLEMSVQQWQRLFDRLPLESRRRLIQRWERALAASGHPTRWTPSTKTVQTKRRRR